MNKDEIRAARAACRVAFYSGMRQGEIVRAEVVDGMFVLHDTKSRMNSPKPANILTPHCTNWRMERTAWLSNSSGKHREKSSALR